MRQNCVHMHMQWLSGHRADCCCCVLIDRSPRIAGAELVLKEELGMGLWLLSSCSECDVGQRLVHNELWCAGKPAGRE